MKLLLIFCFAFIFAFPFYSQQAAPVAPPAASPHRDPTIAELKLEVASLKMQLLQAQGQLLNCQAPAVFREKAAAAEAVRAEREKKPEPAAKPGLDKKPPEKEPPAADK
jgi:hypothetical protein